MSKTVKKGKKILKISVKSFDLIDPPEGTLEDTRNLQSILLRISDLFSKLWGPYVKRRGITPTGF